jgi:hypothetical protein
MAAAKNNFAVAVRHVLHGLPVFPCAAYPLYAPDGTILKKAKRPLIAGGFKNASTDPDLIESWWRQFPEALPAFPTGSRSEIAVMDVDSPAGHGRDGFTALRDLQNKYGTVSTFAVRTASGGLHFYFHFVEGLAGSENVIGEGIDTRAEGGYVIAPGARYPNGTGWFADNQVEIQPLPEWLKRLWPGRGRSLTPFSSTEVACEGETAAGRRELERIALRLAEAPNGRQHHELFVCAAAGGSERVRSGLILRSPAVRRRLCNDGLPESMGLARAGAGNRQRTPDRSETAPGGDDPARRPARPRGGI